MSAAATDVKLPAIGKLSIRTALKLSPASTSLKPKSAAASV